MVAKSAMVLLFVVCGWREEAVAGVCLRKYLVHSTYVFLCTRATIYGKIVKPTVQQRRNNDDNDDVDSNTIKKGTSVPIPSYKFLRRSVTPNFV